ncbi:hypothetical protein GRF59_14495 [Paenibacillus sp. HJL G12]|uniref:Uncharacterized protein n=1 Tax=Paenibacillus dendrobii TaxID=2691084 RepID=A0A7X3LH71_9BACL|nr:hypothetical protein [Paenibacillus dendrobii]MWV44827.1 hypothetical protein [Paenibacillus dendrobii]
MAQRPYQLVWEEDWKHCVTEGGALNLDQIQRELADYSFLLSQVPKVYEEVAGLSKTHYFARSVIDKYEERVEERFLDYVNDFIESIVPDYELHKDSDSTFDNWYADGIKFAIDELKKYAGIKENS